MTNRRKFLGLSALGIAGLTSMSLLGLSACSGRKSSNIGVQLYILRDLMQENVRKALELVAAVGYSEVELAGYYDYSPKELRRMLDGEGLSAPATHLLLGALDKDFDAMLADAKVLGCQYIVLPYLFEHQRTSIDDYKRVADQMNRWGEACQKAGLRFAYHNHDFEFKPLNGEVPYDILLQQTDRQTVFLELDLYWAAKAGQDPVTLFKSHPGRFPLWHLKDMATDGNFADVGDGSIDFQRIFSAAGQAGFEHGFIEHDTTTNPEATIRKGLAAAEGFVVGA